MSEPVRVSLSCHAAGKPVQCPLCCSGHRPHPLAQTVRIEYNSNWGLNGTLTKARYIARESGTVRWMIAVLYWAIAGTVTAAAGERYGDWEYVAEQNPFTEEWTWSARTQSNRDGYFIIRCDSIGLSVIVRTDADDADYRNTRRVSYGFDKGIQYVGTWANLDADKGGGALVEGKEAKRIAKLAAKRSRFLYRTEVDTVVFSLKGSSKAIGRVAGQCRYL